MNRESINMQKFPLLLCFVVSADMRHEDDAIAINFMVISFLRIFFSRRVEYDKQKYFIR